MGGKYSVIKDLTRDDQAPKHQHYYRKDGHEYQKNIRYDYPRSSLTEETYSISDASSDVIKENPDDYVCPPPEYDGMYLSPDYIMDGEDIKSANVLSESQHGECQIVHYENVSFHHNVENDPEEKQHSQIVDVEVHVPNILRKKSLNMYETVPIESHPIGQHRSVDVSPIQPVISYGACLNESEVYSTPVPVPDYTLESNATQEYDLVHSKLSVDSSIFIPKQIDESFSSPLVDSFEQDFVVDDKVEILNSNQESKVIDDNLSQATVQTIIKNIDSTAITSELEVYSVPETELMDKSEEIIITNKLEEPEVTLDGSFQPQDTEENIDPTFVSASHKPDTISTSSAISAIQGISFIEPESFVDIPSQKTKENIDHIDDTIAPKYNLKPEFVVEDKSEVCTKESNEEEPEVTFNNSSKPTPQGHTSVSASHEPEIISMPDTISVAQEVILLEAESCDDIFSQSTSQETKESIDHIALFAPKYIPKAEFSITPSAISVTQEINIIEPETTVDISSQPRSQKTEENIDHTIAVFAPKYNLKPEFCVEDKSEAFTVAKESNEEEQGVTFCSPSQLTSQETDKTLDPASISTSHEPEIPFTPEVTTLTDLESVTVFQNLNPLESVPQSALQQNEENNNFNQVVSLFEQDTRSAQESDVEGKLEAIAVVQETQSKDLEVNIDCSSQSSQETEENVPVSLYEPEINAAAEVIFVTEGTTTALYEPEITAAPEAISVTEGTATALFEPEITFTQESEPKEKSETVSFANENIDNVEITDTSFQPTSNDYESISAFHEPETYTKPELISDTQVNHHIWHEFSVDVLTLSTTVQAEGNINFSPVTTSFESKLNFKPDESPEITSKKEESEDNAFLKPASVSFEPESNVIPTNISEVITQQSNVEKVENLDISSEVSHTIIS